MKAAHVAWKVIDKATTALVIFRDCTLSITAYGVHSMGADIISRRVSQERP